MSREKGEGRVPFPSHRIFFLSVGTLRSDDATATITSKTTTDLVGKKQLCTCISLFSYISLPFCTTTTWNCLILLFRQDVNRPWRNFIRFLYLNMVLRNSTPGGFAYIWQSKWVGIIVIKTERKQIHFWSDVFAAFASSYRSPYSLSNTFQAGQGACFVTSWTKRENNGSEREAPSPVLGICEFHQSYF